MAKTQQTPQPTQRIRRNSSAYLQKVKNTVEMAKNYALIVHGKALTRVQRDAAIYLGELLVPDKDDRSPRKPRIVNNADVDGI